MILITRVKTKTNMMVNKTLLISDNGNNTEYDEHIEDDKEMIKSNHNNEEDTSDNNDLNKKKNYND